MKKFFETAGFNSPLHIPNGIEITNTRTTYQNTLLWVGALTTFKGLPAVIATLSDISIQTGWNIVVVGDGPHKPALESRYPNIDFVGHRDPTQFYRRASILVFSSLGYENFPTVVLEGMQYGLCVVGHNLGGTTELLQHNKTGVLYRTTESLKDNLKLLMNDPMKVRKLGNAAKEFLKTEYRWETCIQRYLNLYKMSITRQSGHK
jgi:glycosyltransferase involved in cell wall biosynthesis